MIEKIAIFINNNGETALLHEEGTIKVFEKKESYWTEISEIPFNISSLKGTVAVRSELFNTGELLGDCNIFVAREITGLTYGVLDSLGFNVWEMEGDITEILGYVYEKELEEELEKEKKLKEEQEKEGNEEESILIYKSKKREMNNILIPIDIEENGCYELNLKKIQEMDTGITSKQVLKPFLNEGQFYELTIRCNHVPGWIEEELVKLNFGYEIIQISSNDYKILVKKKVCYEL